MEFEWKRGNRGRGRGDRFDDSCHIRGGGDVIGLMDQDWETRRPGDFVTEDRGRRIGVDLLL